ncbi:kinase-like domain-containing protein [Gigaspora rosea]|uniref:non-specific serine/threonine protein kinase n=1 Tax=Gigaspora rosea TaxID=44941 RepID=A0A397UCB2_9GLOM|nr:kinase-like domain-containing protein [Gigaspora rosea]
MSKCLNNVEMSKLRNNMKKHIVIAFYKYLIQDGSTLISDFGLSKKLSDSISTSSSGPKGMAAYIEPQCFLQDRPTSNDILTELESLSKEKTVEFITNFIDSDSETSIYSGNLVEFNTDIVDYDSEASIFSGNFLTYAMLFKSFYTLYKNTNTYYEGDFENNMMIVLQYANGGTLQNYLINKIHENIFIISWAEIILITEQIIFGLQNLHNNNVIHGDLHPKNILIVRDNKNKFNKATIADFGSASKFDDSMASLYGRPFTVAIADFNSASKYDDRVTLWELTSGIRPYSKHLNKLALPHCILNGLREKIIPGTPSSYSRL